MLEPVFNEKPILAFEMRKRISFSQYCARTRTFSFGLKLNFQREWEFSLVSDFEHRSSLQMDPKNLQFSLFPGVGCSGGWSQSILLLCRIVPPTTLLKDKNNRRQCIVNQIFQVREDLFLECPSVRGKCLNQCLIEKKKISRLNTRPWQARTPISPIPVLFAPDTKVLNVSNIP